MQDAGMQGCRNAAMLHRSCLSVPPLVWYCATLFIICCFPHVRFHWDIIILFYSRPTWASWQCWTRNVCVQGPSLTRPSSQSSMSPVVTTPTTRVEGVASLSPTGRYPTTPSSWSTTPARYVYTLSPLTRLPSVTPYRFLSSITHYQVIGAVLVILPLSLFSTYVLKLMVVAIT